jgi:hypothetical protein
LARGFHLKLGIPDAVALSPPCFVTSAPVLAKKPFPGPDVAADESARALEAGRNNNLIPTRLRILDHIFYPYARLFLRSRAPKAVPTNTDPASLVTVDDYQQKGV